MEYTEFDKRMGGVWGSIKSKTYKENAGCKCSMPYDLFKVYEDAVDKGATLNANYCQI